MRSLFSDEFFRISETEYDEDNPERFNALIELNKDHEIYKGHFPGNPVVPGVCLIQIIKETLSQHFCKELILVKADDIKFLNIVNPENDPEIELEIKIKHPGDDLVHVNVIVTNSDHICLKFRGSFR